MAVVRLLRVKSRIRAARCDGCVAGFGPVVSDGFGIGYGTTDDGIAFVITTYLGKAQLDKFVAALDSALQQVRNTLSDQK